MMAKMVPISTARFSREADSLSLLHLSLVCSSPAFFIFYRVSCHHAKLIMHSAIIIVSKSSISFVCGEKPLRLSLQQVSLVCSSPLFFISALPADVIP